MVDLNNPTIGLRLTRAVSDWRVQLSRAILDWHDDGEDEIRLWWGVPQLPIHLTHLHHSGSANWKCPVAKRTANPRATLQRVLLQSYFGFYTTYRATKFSYFLFTFALCEDCGQLKDSRGHFNFEASKHVWEYELAQNCISQQLEKGKHTKILWGQEGRRAANNLCLSQRLLPGMKFLGGKRGIKSVIPEEPQGLYLGMKMMKINWFLIPIMIGVVHVMCTG